MRIDKYLWAVRLYKTRSKASEACKKGRVLIDEATVKPSREIKITDEFTVKKTPVNYSYKIKGIPKSRVGAKLVPDYLIDNTPEEELAKLDNMQTGLQSIRKKGEGRPTKKDRRIIDEYFG